MFLAKLFYKKLAYVTFSYNYNGIYFSPREMVDKAKEMSVPPHIAMKQCFELHLFGILPADLSRYIGKRWLSMDEINTEIFNVEEKRRIDVEMFNRSSIMTTGLAWDMRTRARIISDYIENNSYMWTI